MKDRMKIIRKALKLNQSEFGARVGVKGNTIGNYEIGLRNPSDAVIFSICREFGVNEEWLRTGAGEMFVATTIEEEIATAIGSLLNEHGDSFKKRFIAALAALPPESWESVERFAASLAPNKDNNGNKEGS